MLSQIFSEWLSPLQHWDWSLPVMDWFFWPISYSGCWCFVFPAQPGSGPAWLFHDYQPNSGPTTLISHFGFDLIRSISVNHRVSMSTVTYRAWFCKTSLQPTPLSPADINPTHWLFSHFSYDDAHTSSIIHSYCEWKCSSCSITVSGHFPLVLYDIFQTLVTTTHCDLTSLLFYVNEWGKGYTLPSWNLQSALTQTNFPN